MRTRWVTMALQAPAASKRPAGATRLSLMPRSRRSGVAGSRTANFFPADLGRFSAHEHVRDGVGVAVPQGEVSLEPGDDLAAFGQPFFAGQSLKVLGRLAGLGLDVV